MRILLDIGHPGHVHFFRNFIRLMQERGHAIQITARDKEVTLDLLRSYGFPFENRGEMRHRILHKAYEMLKIDARLIRIAHRFQPDILLGFHNPYIAQVSAWLHKPSLIFTDTERVPLNNYLTYPFATLICTPTWFTEPVPPGKHRTFRGFKELAYLHPNYFSPDPAVRDELGISCKEQYILLRLISYGAIHDPGFHGIRRGTEQEFIRTLEDYGRVFVSSEGTLPRELKDYALPTRPDRIHSVLSFADLYTGEGGTMAAESAILGTPAVLIEADAAGRPTGDTYGNFLHLRDTYGLLDYYPDQESALARCVEILSNPHSKEEWRIKRSTLLQDTIDVTAWMATLVEEVVQGKRTGSF